MLSEAVNAIEVVTFDYPCEYLNPGFLILKYVSFAIFTVSEI